MKKILLPILAALLAAVGCTTEPFAENGGENIRTRGTGETIFDYAFELSQEYDAFEYAESRDDENLFKTAYAAGFARFAADRDLEPWVRLSGFYFAWSQICRYNGADGYSAAYSLTIDAARDMVQANAAGIAAATAGWGDIK